MTRIEWTHAPGFKGESWNPMVGCSIVSPGCTNCYAMKMANRVEMMSPSLERYQGLTEIVNGKPVWTGKIARAGRKILVRPITQKTPRMYFVNSMSDPFHEDVPDDWIDEIFAVMEMSTQHIFLILTKRERRMRRYMKTAAQRVRKVIIDRFVKYKRPAQGSWPPRNVWLGVTAEDQARANNRVPYLLDTPAAIRFVSYEPAIAPIDFTRLKNAEFGDQINALTGIVTYGPGAQTHNRSDLIKKLDWVIIGGESGTAARPFDIEWGRDVIAQCRHNGVAVFQKQLGAKPRGVSRLADKKGADPSEWPADLRVKDWPGI